MSKRAANKPHSASTQQQPRAVETQFKSGSHVDAESMSHHADELERVIAHLDTLYERGEECIHPDTGVIVSDGEYDALRRRLYELRPDSQVFQTATASELTSSAKKVIHDPPMTSIEKASHEDQATQEEMLFKWLINCSAEATAQIKSQQNPKQIARTLQTIPGKSYKGMPVEFPLGYFYESYKLDGVALALYYERGKLVRAGLRPRDGINGEDVTEQVRHVAGIPERLQKKVSCSIRGEIICKLSDFAKVQSELERSGERLRANPRNHAAGGIRQFRDPNKTKSMRLSFLAYGIEAFANPPYDTEMECAEFCQKELGVPYIETRPFRFENLAMLESGVAQLDFEVDGVIIGVNSIEDQEQLGRHGDPRTGNPRGKIAWKFREEEATPVIKAVEWQTGRTGKIVGVAIFDPVRLAGTNVSRATLHNAGFMERNQITVGSKISVRKAGKIIPKVTGVLAGHGRPEFPQECPSCGQPTRLASGGSAEMLELVCDNKQCPAQNVNALCHYLDSFGVLGLGESRVTSLVDGSQVAIPADFYKLEVEQAMSCGLTERQSLLAIAAIQMVPTPEKLDNDQLRVLIEEARSHKKRVPLWQLIAALGIESAGKSAGKALESHFRTIENLRNATIEQLQQVEDVGEKTARSIHDYLDEHAVDIDLLLEHVEPEPMQTGKLSGKTFCFSGSFEEGKRYWEQQVDELGGMCTSSVSKKTDYLVAGPGSGSKSEKAEKLSVPIIDVAELQRILANL